MVKISANMSKKVPIPGTEFSSQQFGAAMEIEVSDADQPNVIQARIRDLYGLVTQAVDEQIAAATHAATSNNGGNGRGQVHPPIRRQNYAPSQNQQPASPARGGYAGNGTARAGGNGGNGGNGRRTGATEAQCRAIFAICKSLNLDMNAVLADYNVTDASQLHVKDASRLIDSLKSQQAANQQPAR
ncbi:MAG: hypothetical protein ABSE73_28445 [Planctomycetota bacterium]